MTDAEQPPDQNPTPEQQSTPGETQEGVYLPAKLMGAMCVGLAFIAEIELVVGMESASSMTFKTAGALAVGAACGLVAGFFLDRPSRTE